MLSFTLLTQENFQSNITSSTPDTFNSVGGTLYTQLVGPTTPAVANSLGVSGDAEEVNNNSETTTNPFSGNWTLNDNTKINSQAQNAGFIGGWYRFAFFDDDPNYIHTADIMRLSQGPAITLTSTGQVENYGGYPSGVVIPGNQWVFLGLAWTYSNNNLTYQDYIKLPGQALTAVYSTPPTNNNVPAPTQASLVDLPAGNVDNGRWEGRVGTFFIASINSFSDVQMPSDITDPVEAKHWYGVDPVNGNDNNDGIVIPEFAPNGTTVIGFAAGSQPWKTLTRVNTALEDDTLFTQTNAWLNASNATPVDETRSVTDLQSAIAAATVIRNPLIDELVIDTASGPFNISASGGVNGAGGLQLDTNINLSGFGSTVGSMSGVADLQAFVTIAKSSWTQVPGDSSLYESTNTAANAVLWQNQEWMTHVTGTSFSAVQAGLDASSGSFWTDGATLYVHPFGNTNPATDSSVYQRSPGGTSTNSIGLFVNVDDPCVHNLAIGGTCGADPVTNDPIGLYCVGTSQSEGIGYFADMYLYYSSKHAFCWTGSQNNQRLIVSNVDCEQGSPYAGAGGQYLFTNYNAMQGALGNEILYLNCTAVHSAGEIGSTQGTTLSGQGTFYSHNGGGDDQMDITFINCNFDGSIQTTNAANNLIVENSTIGTIGTSAANLTATDDTTTADIIRATDGTVTDCIMHANVIFGAGGNSNNFQGSVAYNDDVFDSRGAITMDVAYPSYFYGIGPSTLTFDNCTFLTTIPEPVLYHFQSTDTLNFQNNTYDTTAADNVVDDLINGNIVYYYSLAGWQAAGHDVGSTQSADGSTPSGYTAVDIGSPATTGTSILNSTSGITTQEGGGAGIGGSSDQFDFIYSTTTGNGNGNYTVEASAQLGAGAGSSAGLMLRSSTAANSAFAQVALVAGDGIEFQWRSSTGASAQSIIVPSVSGPIWLSLLKSGNSIAASFSYNDISWTQIGSAQTVALPTPAMIGTAVAGTPSAALTGALFSTPQFGPNITNFMVNNASPQRAMVNSLTVAFSESVTLKNAFTLNQVQTNGNTTSMPFTATSPDGGFTWVLTFTQSQYVGGSLPDGNYTLTISAAGVTDASGTTLQGGNHQFSFYRLYGDFLGSGSITGADFAILAQYFGRPVGGTSFWYVDYYNTGSVTGADFAEFAARWGQTIPPVPAVIIPAVTTPSVILASDASTNTTLKSNAPLTAPQKTSARHPPRSKARNNHSHLSVIPA